MIFIYLFHVAKLLNQYSKYFIIYHEISLTDYLIPLKIGSNFHISGQENFNPSLKVLTIVLLGQQK